MELTGITVHLLTDRRKLTSFVEYSPFSKKAREVGIFVEPKRSNEILYYLENGKQHVFMPTCGGFCMFRFLRTRHGFSENLNCVFDLEVVCS